MRQIFIDLKQQLRILIVGCYGILWGPLKCLCLRENGFDHTPYFMLFRSLRSFKRHQNRL